MEKQASIPKHKGKNAARQMWAHEEDKILLEIVNLHGKLKWSLVAEELKKRLPSTSKTGKQCRERYRNYLDPSISKKEWTKSDKIVFLLLHKEYGNHWGQIAKYYVGRSDISLKNLFYSYVRRVLRSLKDETLPHSVASKPRKVLEAYYVIDVVHTKYLPIIMDPTLMPLEEKHEKILITLIKDKHITEKDVVGYKKALIAAFKEANSTATFPIPLWVTTDGLNLAEGRGELLRTMISGQSFGDLCPSLILIKFMDNSEPVPVAQSPPSTPPGKMSGESPLSPMVNSLVSNGLLSSSLPVPEPAATGPAPVRNLDLVPRADRVMDPTTIFNPFPRLDLPRVPQPYTSSSYQPLIPAMPPPGITIPRAPMFSYTQVISPSFPSYLRPVMSQPQQMFFWPVMYPVVLPNSGMPGGMIQPRPAPNQNLGSNSQGQIQPSYEPANKEKKTDNKD